MAFPGADGPRVVRQYVVAAMPAIVAPFLLDRTPEVSLTLVRDGRQHLLGQSAVALAVYAALISGWLGGIALHDGLYELFVTQVLLSAAFCGTARYGLAAVLAVPALAVTWLLVGDTLAAAFGFGIVDYQTQFLLSQHDGRWFWLGLATVFAGASFLLGLSRSWRSGLVL